MTKKRMAWLGVGLVAVSLTTAAAGGTFARQKGKEVRTEEVARRDLVSVVTSSGVIQPKRKVDISADISGRVIELAVEEGQLVRRGDLLLRIDPTAYQAAVRRAEAAVAQAQAQAAQARANLLQSQSGARRAEQLSRGDQLISSQDVEQAVTAAQVAEAQHEAARYAVQQAQATLSEMREALRKTTIVSPMDGRVTRLNIEEGETAIVGTMNNPGSLLLTVADLSVMEASVRVDETDVPRISFGDSAVVRIDAFPDQTFTGRVTRIANSAMQSLAASAGQAQAVDFEVIVTLDAPPDELRPDLSATAEIVTDARAAAVSVPIIAVTVRDSAGKKFAIRDEGAAATNGRAARQAEVEGVFLLRDGRAAFVPVRIGIAGERFFEVQQGLDGGETVVAGPYSVIRDLQEGDAVRVAPPADAPRRGLFGRSGS
jgi:HlyD family secretion protein